MYWLERLLSSLFNFFLIQLVAFNGNMSLLPVHPQQQITDQNHRLDSIWFGHYFDFSQPKRCLFAYEYSIHKDISVCFQFACPNG